MMDYDYFVAKYKVHIKNLEHTISLRITFIDLFEIAKKYSKIIIIHLLTWSIIIFESTYFLKTRIKEKYQTTSLCTKNKFTFEKISHLEV